MRSLDLDRLAELLLGSRAQLPPLVLRLAAGAIFLGFSVGKFSHHAKETASFERYGLPFAGEFVYAIGATELVFGALLVLGLATRLAALALAGDMIGAISTGGRVDGGFLHLGLAPILLVTMLVLVWLGAGRFSVDEWALARVRRRRPSAGSSAAGGPPASIRYEAPRA